MGGYDRWYKEAREPLAKVGTLTRRLDREAEFEEYPELIRAEYKPKRNFAKLRKLLEGPR